LELERFFLMSFKTYIYTCVKYLTVQIWRPQVFTGNMVWDVLGKVCVM
jgi:hypothetical protein